MTTLPESFKLIDVPLPPMLLQMAGVNKESRFVSLYYWRSKATWHDGRSSATFPFFTVWQPYTQHLAIAIHLFDYHLGSDEQEPSHALVCDRRHQKVYVAKFDEAEEFVNNQHPPRQLITPEQWSEIKAQLQQKTALDMSQMQSLGMFEWVVPPTEAMQIALVQMVQWLDQYINEPLLKNYLQVAKAGEYKAIWALEKFKHRCQ